MTSKERFMAALTGKMLPDRVPVAPDISGQVPARLSGHTFWDVFLHLKYPRWLNYIAAADHFGMDGWIGSCLGVPLTVAPNTRVTSSRREVFNAEEDAIDVFSTIHTPDGDLTSSRRYPKYDSAAPMEGLIKDMRRDFPRYRWLQTVPTGIDLEAIEEPREACRKRDWAFGMALECPGLQSWNGVFDGGLITMSYAVYDHPDLFEEWRIKDTERAVRAMELALTAEPDYLLLHASGAIVLASPDLFRQYALPGIKAMAHLAREAGVPTMLHACGKSRTLLDILADETEVDLLNPIEGFPAGDVDLAEAKATRGSQISLMGNLHTSNVMLFGTPADVERDALLAMAAAGKGGRFLLSTGDQCPRDTPDGNIFKLVETATRYGTYDTDGSLPLVEEALSHIEPSGGTTRAGR